MKKKLFLSLSIVLGLFYWQLHNATHSTYLPLSVQPQKLGIKVNGQDAGLDEYSLNDLFAAAFSDMLANPNSGVKESEREAFFKTYQQFLKQAKEGTYDINSGGGKYLNSIYNGPADANLGVNADGSNAKKSFPGQVFSNHNKKDRQRMALLNTYLGDRIIQAFSKQNH